MKTLDLVLQEIWKRKCNNSINYSYGILYFSKDHVESRKQEVLLEAEVLLKLVCKIWKQLTENILTTIISDGSKTMHSHPRLKLPAERLPKLKNKNTSIRNQSYNRIHKHIYISSRYCKAQKRHTYLCTIQVSCICPSKINRDPRTLRADYFSFT